MTRVVIVSPLGAISRLEIDDNKEYAKRCVLDCLDRGESPYAAHLFFDQPGVLDDTKIEDRALGMNAGVQWGMKADKVVVYMDRKVSEGMKTDITFYKYYGIPIEYRWLDKE